MVAQATQQPTWHSEARLRDQALSSIAYDNGVAVRPLALRRSGYLERLRLIATLNGAYTVAGPTGVDAFGQYCGPLKRVTVRANAVGTIYDLAGYNVALVSALDTQYNAATDFSLTHSPYAFTASPALAAFANVWAFEVPVGLYLANKPFPLGLFQTAINGQETTLEVQFNDAAGSAGAPGSTVYTGNAGNLAGETGNVFVNQQYYDPIADPAAQPYLGWLHRWRDFQKPLTADGDLTIDFTAGNYYTRILFTIVAGGAGALAPIDSILTSAKLSYGGNSTPFDESRNQILSRQARQYGAALPTGTVVFDLLEKTHTDRDAINSALTTDLRAILNFSGGTYSGGAYVLVAVEEMVPLELRAVGGPAVQ